MKLLEFFDHYPDEQSCKAAFKARRLQEGVVCQKRGNNAHYWKKKRKQWNAKNAATEQLLKAVK